MDTKTQVNIQTELHTLCIITTLLKMQYNEIFIMVETFVHQTTVKLFVVCV